MNTEQQSSIRRYLNGDMTDSASREFEQACQSDPELMASLKIELQTRYILKQTARNTYISEAQVLDTKPSTFYVFYRIAAAVSVLVMIGFAIYFLSRDTYDSRELYAENYTIPAISQVRDATTAADSLWSAATVSYVQQDWSKASGLFETYIATADSTIQPQTQLLLGICYLEMGNPLEAISAFSTLENPRHPYYYDARWYSALSYLKEDSFEGARKELNILLDSNKYKSRAEILLSKL